MYTIRAILSGETTWLRSADFHNLFSQATESVLLSEKEFEKWFDNMHNNPYSTLFGVFDEYDNGCKLVGVGTLWMQPKYYHNNAKSGLLEDIVIDENHQGKGLGKKLVHFIIETAQQKGCHKIILNCTQENIPVYQNFFKDFKSKSLSATGMVFHFKSYKHKDKKPVYIQRINE